MDSVLCEIKNGVAYVTLNQPERGNAFSPEIKAGLTGILRELRGDYSVRAIVFTGAGKLFSAGGDISSMGDRQNCLEGRDRMRLAVDWLKELVNIEKPTIAAVNGAAAGGGLSLALACDFIVSAESAKFISSFGNIGLVADMASMYFLPRRVGMAKAKEIALWGTPMAAAEAKEIGLVDMVVPLERLLPSVKEMAEALAKRPTYAVGMTKKMINASFETDFNTFLDMEVNYQAVAFQTEDHKNAVHAFLEKKAPQFIGK